MNKTESYCYQKYKSSSNNSCVIKEKNIVGKNLLEGTYFDGDGIPKMIGITKAEYLEYKKLQQENKQLKIQISAREEVCNRLESNWNKLNKKYENAVADYEKTMFEKEQLKKQLEEKNKPQIFIDTQNIEERYAEGLYQDYLEEENKKHKNQQKEFIEYMNKTIEELESDNVDDEEMKGHLIQRIGTFKEILQKYKSIIGDIDENN